MDSKAKRMTAAQEQLAAETVEPSQFSRKHVEMTLE